MNQPLFLIAITVLLLNACKRHESAPAGTAIIPDVTTDTTLNDTDDPAIWIHPTDPKRSLILGTDKGDSTGGIYAYDLEGKIVNRILDLPRPNNIDIEYGYVSEGDTFDIAAFTLRNGDQMRILRLPEMVFIDNGGIDVFSGEDIIAPMGIGIYKDPATQSISVIVGRKSGPDGSYLWQYLLTDSSGVMKTTVVRKFGAFKGGNEIEAICVDDAAGYVYYADEGAGIRKYYASPDSNGVELAFFGQRDFKEDHEGISIYPTGNTSGYILISDQQANCFNVYPREGSPTNPHAHNRILSIPFSTNESDGSDVTSVAIPGVFPNGFFVAMSDNKTFQIYNWNKIKERIEAASK